jgi:hypothetical protein
MFANRTMRPAVSLAVLTIVALGLWAAESLAAAPTGGFLAVLNESRNFGDSMNCITFLDADDPTVPLFSVYVGKEPVGSNEWEEPSAITVDPATGDLYVVCFDSGTTGVNDSAGDTQGDLDLLRIPFASVYDHWSANFQGQDVRTLANPNTWGSAPTGVNNASNLDYVTYTSVFADFNFGHSNTYELPGSVSKIGQVARGNGNSFFGFNLEFFSDDKLYLLDDSVGSQSTDNPLDDHSIRVIERVSTSPGMATTTTVMPGGGASNYIDGGWNGAMAQAATESWESRLIAKLNMDGATHSEPRAMAYYDNGAGVRGLWIVEGDFSSTTMQSDKIGFYQLDANDNFVGYRPFVSDGNPFFKPVSDDPQVDPNSNNGRIHEVFVDEDGSLVIIESGFPDGPDTDGPGPDPGDGVHPTDEEPAVLRIPVNYDNGFGEMVFGSWEKKLFLFAQGDYNKDGKVNAADNVLWKKNEGTTNVLSNDPHGGTIGQNQYDRWEANFDETGGSGGNKGTDDNGVEFSQHATFDPVNNIVYFFSPDNGGVFNTDMHALDLDTGVVTSFLNWDDSVSLFGDVDSDSVHYFFMSSMVGGGAAGVPEPASLILLLLGILPWCCRRRRAA